MIYIDRRKIADKATDEIFALNLAEGVVGETLDNRRIHRLRAILTILMRRKAAADNTADVEGSANLVRRCRKGLLCINIGVGIHAEIAADKALTVDVTTRQRVALNDTRLIRSTRVINVNEVVITDNTADEIAADNTGNDFDIFKRLARGGSVSADISAVISHNTADEIATAVRIIEVQILLYIRGNDNVTVAIEKHTRVKAGNTARITRLRRNDTVVRPMLYNDRFVKMLGRLRQIQDIVCSQRRVTKLCEERPYRRNIRVSVCTDDTADIGVTHNVDVVGIGICFITEYDDVLIQAGRIVAANTADVAIADNAAADRATVKIARIGTAVDNIGVLGTEANDTTDEIAEELGVRGGERHLRNADTGFYTCLLVQTDNTAAEQAIAHTASDRAVVFTFKEQDRGNIVLAGDGQNRADDTADRGISVYRGIIGIFLVSRDILIGVDRLIHARNTTDVDVTVKRAVRRHERNRAVVYATTNANLILSRCILRECNVRRYGGYRTVIDRAVIHTAKETRATVVFTGKDRSQHNILHRCTAFDLREQTDLARRRIAVTVNAIGTDHEVS